MKHVAYLLLATMLIAFYSCMPDASQIWIDKDGSGKMVVTINAEESMGPIVQILNALDTTNTVAGKGFDMGEKMDSLVYFSQIVPDSIRRQQKHPELTEKIHIRIRKGDGNMTIDIGMDYDDQEELEKIRYTFHELQALKKGKSYSQKDGEQPESIFTKYSVDTKNGIARIADINIESLGEEEEISEVLAQYDSLMIMKENFDQLSEEKQEEFQFMYAMYQSMFLKEMTTTMHLPGKVEFSNRPNARIDGNTIFLYN